MADWLRTRSPDSGGEGIVTRAEPKTKIGAVPIKEKVRMVTWYSPGMVMPTYSTKFSYGKSPISAAPTFIMGPPYLNTGDLLQFRESDSICVT